MFFPRPIRQRRYGFFGEREQSTTVAVYCDFLEVWDTEKARLVQL